MSPCATDTADEAGIEIPDAEPVRRRLAVILTEADVLRAQLKVSERLARERERLRRQAQSGSWAC
jgi:hypothetical protein